MNESILNSVKFSCGGIIAADTAFDSEIINRINECFVQLAILGVKRSTPFILASADQKWSDWIDNSQIVMLAKSYISDSVRLAFDPPASSSAVELLKNNIDKKAYMINLLADVEGGNYVG